MSLEAVGSAGQQHLDCAKLFAGYRSVVGALRWTLAAPIFQCTIACLCSFFVGVVALSLYLPAEGTNEPLFSGLGSYTRRVDGASEQGQRYFDQGLMFLYGFNHDEAIRSFEAAATRDPKCAMAYWGIAMANGPYLNNMDIDPVHARTAWVAAMKARELETAAAPVERDLIEAVATRYANPPPDDRQTLDRTYADAMVAVYRSHPEDIDVGALTAEALLDLRPLDYWTPDGKPQPRTDDVLRILDSVLAKSPTHPFALHLLIHALERSPFPERAADAADRLRDLTPGLEHLLHMPSHIDIRLGHWDQAVAANERAIDADDLYWKVVTRERFGAFRYHNYHLLAHATMMEGQQQKAGLAIERMLSSVPEEAFDRNPGAYDGYGAMRYEWHLRFGRWDAMLSEPEPRGDFPITRALWHFGRGIAHAARREVSLALAERLTFDRERRAAPEEATFRGTPASSLLNIADKMLMGEILLRQGKADEALVALREAVEAEDRLGLTEPPSWSVPTRHALGATLMYLGSATAAEAVYRSDLARQPENGWALWGLYRSLRVQGKKMEAALVKSRFDRAWAHADFKVSSSCCCLPDRAEADSK